MRYARIVPWLCQANFEWFQRVAVWNLYGSVFKSDKFIHHAVMFLSCIGRHSPAQGSPLFNVVGLLAQSESVNSLLAKSYRLYGSFL